jgi:hypothetical protein
MAGEAELVLLGIQAAIRINAQYRKGFADSVRNSAITVPLPNFNPAPDLATALTFYLAGDGAEFKNSNLRVKALCAKAQSTGPLSFTPAENAELMALYREHFALVQARNGTLVGTDAANPALFSNRDIVAMLQIRQWRQGQEPNPNMLRRLAGTFIEIAADYFANYSPMATANSAPSKALVAFLRAIEPIDFAEGAPQQVVEQLFIATVETVRDNADLISKEQWAQTLIHDVASGVYTDAKKFLDAAAGDLSKQDRVVRWSQIVYRAALKSAGDTVFDNPATFFAGLNAGQADLAARVGRSILGAIVTDTGVAFDRLLTPDAVDGIASAAFAAVAANPSLIAVGNDRLQKLIGAGVQQLQNAHVIKLILERTAKNPDVLMPGPDAASNLLLAGAKQVFAILGAPVPGGATWKTIFGPAQIEVILRVVVTQVAANPAWVGDGVLGSVTQSVADALRKRAGATLGVGTAAVIFEAAYQAVGQRLQLASRNPANQLLVGAAVESLFGAVFSPGVNAEARWVLARDEGVARLTSIVLDTLARRGASPALINATVAKVQGAIDDLGQGKPWSFESFATSLDSALANAAAGGV